MLKAQFTSSTSKSYDNWVFKMYICHSYRWSFALAMMYLKMHRELWLYTSLPGSEGLDVWTLLPIPIHVESKSHLPNGRIRQKFHKHNLTYTLCRNNPQRGLFGSCCTLSWSITIAPKISCQVSHTSLTQFLSHSCSFSSYLLSKKTLRKLAEGEKNFLYLFK